MFIKISGLLLLLALICVPLFLHLDYLPFRLWDESRLASNAYEMHKNGNFIVTHYDGVPEMWNTKPPLMIWLQVFFIKLIGFNELSIRLPAAIAGLLTCVVLVLFSYKHFKSLLPGAFAGLVLVTTHGYIDAHAIRTGDYDGLLALFTTLFVLSIFKYTETGNKKWAVAFFTGITLAVLTKSVQSLLFLPAIVIYFLFRKKWQLIYARHFIAGIVFSCLIVGAYYFTREVMNEGYLLAIWNNELGGRYFNALEENNAGPMYYVSRMGGYLFPYWIWFLPVAFLAGILSKSDKIKNLSLFLFLATATYFLFITFSRTKLYWYTVPLFPLLALQVAVFLFQCWQYLTTNSVIGKYPSVALLLIVVAFIYPYTITAKEVYSPKEYSWDNMYPISELLQDAFHGKTSLHNHVIVYSDYDQHFKVYTNALADKGQTVFYKQPQNLVKGDTVIVSEDSMAKQVETMYDEQLLKQQQGVKIYLIK